MKLKTDAERNSEKNNAKKFLRCIFIAVVAVMFVASFGMSSASFMSMFGPGRVEAAMTQTQSALDKLISDIMKDKNLTDEQKAMLVQSLRTFSADCIVSMDDARLLIDWLIDSDLLTDDQVVLLSSLRDLIDSGDITDVNLVKAVLSNVLAHIKGYIVGEKSPTYMELEKMCEDIKEDATLTEGQKTQYLDILYGLMSDELELVGLNDAESVKELIKVLLDNEMLVDPATEDTLTKLLSDLENGKNINLDVVREVLKYAFTQMMGDDTLTDAKKELLAELVNKYTNENSAFTGFESAEDAMGFIERIYDSGLVKDAHIIRDMETVITAAYEGKDVGLDVLNDVISRALSDIYASLLSEKISVLTGKDAPEGVNAKEYYEKLIARCTSSRFNYIETLANCNKTDIQNLYESIDQNMILSEEQRLALLESLKEYQQNNDDTLSLTAEELRALIDGNTQMDAKTKAGLITMINQIDDGSSAGIAELREKLREKSESLSEADGRLKKELDDLQEDLEAADQENLKKLKSDIKKLENNTNDSFDRTGLDIAAVRKELAENAKGDDLTAAALRSDLAALDRKTAEAILDLAEDTDSRLEALRQDTNDRINALEADTNDRIDTLESDTNDRFEQMEADTDAKIATLRQETNTALALLRSDLETVEQSVVDTNAAMTTMNETLIARDEDMKSALGVSMLASFTNLETFLSTMNANNAANFNAMYVDLSSKLHQMYVDNQTNHNNTVNAMGDQFDYTLNTSGSQPVLTFTPHTATASSYTATDPGSPTSYGDYVETDDPSGLYSEPVYSEP